MKHPHLFSFETDLPYVAQDSQIMPPAPRCYDYKWEHMDNVCLLGLHLSRGCLKGPTPTKELLDLDH